MLQHVSHIASKIYPFPILAPSWAKFSPPFRAPNPTEITATKNLPRICSRMVKNQLLSPQIDDVAAIKYFLEPVYLGTIAYVGTFSY